MSSKEGSGPSKVPIPPSPPFELLYRAVMKLYTLSCASALPTRSFAPVVTAVLWAVPRTMLTFGFNVFFTIAGGCGRKYRFT